MSESNDSLVIKDLVLVQPMRYCYTFTQGGIENLLVEDKTLPNYTDSHWTGDGFKARILQIINLEKPLEGTMITEEYVQVKIFGQGRKHYIKRDGEKTKVVWIQKRLVSKCRDDKKK